MIIIENNYRGNNDPLPGLNASTEQRMLLNEHLRKPAWPNSLFVEIEEALLEMQMKEKNSGYVEENY